MDLKKSFISNSGKSHIVDHFSSQIAVLEHLRRQGETELISGLKAIGKMAKVKIKKGSIIQILGKTNRHVKTKKVIIAPVLSQQFGIYRVKIRDKIALVDYSDVSYVAN